MGKEKLLKFEEGMEKFDKEFNLIFDIHLNHFMDALCYVGRIYRRKLKTISGRQ